jgi:hypothetical protein
MNKQTYLIRGIRVTVVRDSAGRLIYRLYQK